MKKITLTQGKTALVDDDFFAYCQQEGLKFHFLDQGKQSKHRGYAMYEGRLGKVRMHHLVLQFHGVDVPSGMDVDHINGNRLDNRFENLQIVTRTQNLLKKDRQYPNKTGYRGVIERKDFRFSKPRYRAFVSVKGKNIWFGTYDTPEDAARAHDENAKRLHGPFANLNFP